MNIALIGPSGVGKGTHAEHLVANFGLAHVSTGDLFRRNLEDETALGIMARKYMSTGELVPDELTQAMMEEWLRRSDPKAGVLFDGFPRTVYQAKFIDELFAGMGRSFDGAFYLDVADEIVVGRLANRLICAGCQTTYHRTLRPPARADVCDRCNGALYRRPDDHQEMVRNRLRVFHRATGPVLEYFQSSGRLVIINGEGEVDSVRDNLVAAVEAADRGVRPDTTEADVARLSLVRPTIQAATSRTRMDMVLLGGPGSGKGTQAERLSDTLELPHIATGDLFRENLKQQTDLGKLAKTYMDRGELVPDDVTEAMMAERLSRQDTREGFILDGFPRTLPQAQALTDILNEAGRRLAGVLYIDVSDEEIVSRLSGRVICRDCQTPFHLKFKPPAKAGICDRCSGELYQRDDDNADTIRARLLTFHGQTAPLVDYYREAGVLHQVQGEGPLQEVNARTLKAAKRLKAN